MQPGKANDFGLREGAQQMLRPTKANLARSSGGVSFCSADYSLNQNRRVYKYYWQVYTEDSPWEDDRSFKGATIPSTEDIPCPLSPYHERLAQNKEKRCCIFTG